MLIGQISRHLGQPITKLLTLTAMSKLVQIPQGKKCLPSRLSGEKPHKCNGEHAPPAAITCDQSTVKLTMTTATRSSHECNGEERKN